MWVDLCGPSKEQLHELAGELGLHELAVEDSLSAPSAAEAGPVRHPPVPLHPGGAARRRRRPTGRDRGRRLHQPPLADHRPQGRPVPDRAGPRPLGPLPGPRRARGRLPALRAARRRRRRVLRRHRGVRRVLRGRERRNVRGAAPRARSATPLVRDAPGDGPLPSSRGTDARGGQQPHATGTSGGDRGAVPVLPGRLRPHPAGQRVLRLAARPGGHHRRDQPQPA